VYRTPLHTTLAPHTPSLPLSLRCFRLCGYHDERHPNAVCRRLTRQIPRVAPPLAYFLFLLLPNCYLWLFLCLGSAWFVIHRLDLTRAPRPFPPMPLPRLLPLDDAKARTRMHAKSTSYALAPPTATTTHLCLKTIHYTATLQFIALLVLWMKPICATRISCRCTGYTFLGSASCLSSASHIPAAFRHEHLPSAAPRHPSPGLLLALTHCLY